MVPPVPLLILLAAGPIAYVLADTGMGLRILPESALVAGLVAMLVLPGLLISYYVGRAKGMAWRQEELLILAACVSGLVMASDNDSPALGLALVACALTNLALVPRIIIRAERRVMALVLGYLPAIIVTLSGFQLR